jgi:signal transduction histidine kinase/signal recognition particle receptor subunit beta
MVQFDNQYRQIKIKIVYYGPALGGKTTCLQYLHGTIDPQRRTRLYTLRTAADRTLFFDLLSLDLGRVRGYKLVVQLFTVPGQVQYDTTRRAVLSGADGVVFVADSQASLREANRDSLLNLAANLQANGLDAATIPTVFLFNKRDLDDTMPADDMNEELNRSGRPCFETVATEGRGVMESFAAGVEATVVSIAGRLGVAGQPDALDRLLRHVRAALEPHLRAGTSPLDTPVVLRPASGGGILHQDELVSEAVRANVAMTELNVQLDRVTRELETRVRHLRFLNQFSRLMTLAREPDEVTGALLDRLLAELGAASGALLVTGEDGALVELTSRGVDADPLLSLTHSDRPVAEVVLEARVPLLVRGDDVDEGDERTSRWGEELRRLGIVSALAVPLIAQDEPLGVITAYAREKQRRFEDSDLELTTVLAANAAVALANARAWRQLEAFNASLEATVAERTQELKSANQKLSEAERLKGDLLQRVGHELNTPVTAIQTASRILARYDELPGEKAAKFVDIIAEQTSRLSELIDSALQAVVLGAADGAGERVPVGITDLLRRVLAAQRTEVARLSLAVNLRVAPGLEHVPGDPRQLETALGAIVRNAVEFNRKGGRVSVTVRRVRSGGCSEVEIGIEDSGIGIPADDVGHVCEPFWQGGDLLTEKPRGLGLGLTVAQRVIAAHGGRIDFDSRLGEGTTVTVFLPLEGGDPDRRLSVAPR